MTTSIKETSACFQFKASFAPCTILQIARYDLESLEQQLNEVIARAPNLFIGSPVAIDLEKIKTITQELNFIEIKQILIRAGLVPVGVRGGTPEQMTTAISAGLPMIAIGKTSSDTKNKEESAKKEEKKQITKLVNSPIRSGMQVYAKGGDLIVVGQVSYGAELLADGHIHVYGPLRGRALAGIEGDTHARIFCRTLEAELVSIAGYYLTKEDMQTLPPQHGMIQIYLDNEQVKIEII